MYEMQVKIGGVFKSIRQSHSETPYRYNTVEEAHRSLRMCYPDSYRIAGETRVIDLDGNPVDFDGNIKHGILNNVS